MSGAILETWVVAEILKSYWHHGRRAPLHGVGLRFPKELELGKPTLRMDKVQQVLQFFGCELGAVPLPEEAPRDTRYHCKLQSVVLDFQGWIAP